MTTQRRTPICAYCFRKMKRGALICDSCGYTYKSKKNIIYKKDFDN